MGCPKRTPTQLFPPHLRIKMMKNAKKEFPLSNDETLAVEFLNSHSVK